MGCCCSKKKDINEPIIKIEDLTIDDISHNFHELGSCFVCKKNGIDVKWYNTYCNTYCDKCYYDLINFRLDNL